MGPMAESDLVNEMTDPSEFTHPSSVHVVSVIHQHAKGSISQTNEQMSCPPKHLFTSFLPVYPFYFLHISLESNSTVIKNDVTQGIRWWGRGGEEKRYKVGSL